MYRLLLLHVEYAAFVAQKKSVQPACSSRQAKGESMRIIPDVLGRMQTS